MVTFILETHHALQQTSRTKRSILLWAAVDLFCLYLLVGWILP
ncbi:hypothetical protein VPHD51_0053 [Vibrio phage D51]